MIYHVWAPGTNYRTDFYLELFCILISFVLLFGYILQSKNKPKGLALKNSAIKYIIITNIITLTFSSGTFYFSHNDSFYNFFRLCQLGSFIFYYIQILLFHYYFCISNENIFSNFKIASIIVTFLIVLSASLFFITYFSGLCLFKDSNNKYIKGDFFYTLKAFAPSVLLIDLFIALKNRKKLPKLEIYGWFLYIVLPILSIPLSILISPVYFYLSIFLSIFISYIFINILEHQLLIEEDNQNIRDNMYLTKIQTQIMMSQIQPHFLFNSLASISALCSIDPKLAEQTTNKFSEYLRMNLNSIRNPGNVPFEKELEHIKAYIWLEKIRFDNRLNVDYNILETDFLVPQISIQPLVENAVKHGICAKPEGGVVKISSVKNDNEYLIIIEDNGVGFNTKILDNPEKNVSGIINCRNRIATLNGGYFDIESEIGKGTIVTVHIPIKVEQ